MLFSEVEIVHDIVSKSKYPPARICVSMTQQKELDYGFCPMRQVITNFWNFIFNSNISPLRHIEDVSTRHYVLQALGFMWAVAFSIAMGSYTVFAASVIGHAVLIGAAAITVATYAVATMKPALFKFNAGRRRDGEHE